MGDQFHSGGICSSSSWWSGVAAARSGRGAYGPVVGLAPTDPFFSCPSIDVGMIMRSPAAPFLGDDVQDPMVGTGLIITPDISQYEDQQMSDYGSFTASSRDDFSWSNPKFFFSMDKAESSWDCGGAAVAASSEKEACSTTPFTSFEQQLHVGVQTASMDPSSMVLDHQSRQHSSIYSDVATASGACATERAVVLDGPVNVSASTASAGSFSDLVDCYPPLLNHDLSQLQQQLMMSPPLPDQHDHAHQISHYEGSYYASVQSGGSSHFINSSPQLLEETKQLNKTGAASIKRKSDSEATKNSGTTRRKNSSPESSTSSASKKPRIEMPSSLPTFNVRKEKLQDRVTALQQLVSPFGKTDTASVLHEAIEYIRFLHDQVQVLSDPYLNSGQSAVQQQQNYTGDSNNDNNLEIDLRSRGLCLVPISSTFVIANEPVADYWTSIFGGSTY